MTDFLKGTYKIKKEIVDEKITKDEYAEKAKASVGGSMVFVERKKMVWKGEKSKKNSSK